MVDAAARLARHHSVSAKLRQQVNLFGHQVIGSGTYLQQGRGDTMRLRMELKLHVGGQLTSLQQVSDGTSFWVREDIEGTPTVKRIDLARVRTALARREPIDSAGHTSLAVGGLPRLLESLNRAFRFGAVSKGRLDQLDVWTVEGDWERSFLAVLAPDQAERLKTGAPPDYGRLPEHLPNRVRVTFARDDLFPYRIEYRKVRHDGQVATGPADGDLVVLMELFEVQFDAAINARNFVFQPAKFDDVTSAYLKSLGIADETARVAPAPDNLAR